MADKKPVEAASAAPGEKRSVTRPPLARASESGDPEVHKVLGDLHTARQNLAVVSDAHAAEDADAEAAEADALRRLEELGFRE
jgi:hypothetical protein